MKNITYEQFCMIINGFVSFNSDDLNNLYNEYGEEKVNDFFEKCSNCLNEEEFNAFAKKFTVYFDKVNNLDTNYREFGCDDDIVRYLLINASKFPLLTDEEEKLYGSYIKEGFNDNFYGGFYNNLLECNPWLSKEKIKIQEEEMEQNFENAFLSINRYNQKLTELIRLRDSFGYLAK